VILFFFLVSSVSVGALPLAFAAVPDAPTNLRPSTSPTTTSIFLAWNTPASDGGQTITGYKIEQAREISFDVFDSYIVIVADTESSSTTHTVSGLSSGDFFKFRVSAINASGSGTTSNEFMIGPQKEQQDLSKGKQQFSGGQNFGEGSKFAEGQDFKGDDHDFGQKSMEYGSGSAFAPNETFGEAADFSKGVQGFDGANTFEKDSKFAASQTFAAAQTFDGANTFGAGMEFADSQNFGNMFETSGSLGMAPITVAEGDFRDILQTLDTPLDTITALNSGLYTTGIIYADFSSVLSGSAINDVAFTDSNGNGKIDCISDGECELADLSTADSVRLDGSETIVFDQDPGQSFGPNTVFGAGTTFGKGQTFLDVQDFSGGAMNFVAGMKFLAASQDFDEPGVDHDFNKKGMEFAYNSDFAPNETFGEAANFSNGVQGFDGANTFQKDSKFAPSQTFAAFFDTAGDMELDVTATGLTNWYDIIQLISVTDVNGSPTTGVVGTINSITAKNSGSYTNGGIIYADFTVVTSGPQINDVLFTDGQAGGTLGVIDCVGTAANQCELADLLSPVIFADGAIVTFEQFPTQTFGANTVFGTGTAFANGQAFTTVQDFSSGAMIFKPGMEFAASQDFDEPGVDHDFNKKGIEFGTNTDFKPSETFGEAGDFDAGVQLFDGANTFGQDSKFAAAQTFAVPQTFAGSNTFGAGTQFPPAQDFSTAGSVTSTSIAVATDVAINTLGKQNTAFPTIEASSGLFESGKKVTITFSNVDNPTSEDKIQQVLFTDANKNGIIEDGELGQISTVTTSSDTITVTQAKIQDFSAGVQTFGDAVKFAENQEFDDNVQNFGTGTEFTGNAVFNAAQTFTDSTTFDDGQEFAAVADPNSAFTATGITFGSDEPIVFADADLKFGAEATFPVGQDFSAGAANDFSADDINFKAGTVFHASETFGTHVDFEGAITFPDALDMPTGAEFAAQTFANGATPAFDDFSTFADNTVFEDTAITFEENTHFEGATTFADSSTHTFKEGTVFDGALTLTANTHITYDGDSIDFGPSSNLSAKVQDFASGATATIPQFGTGTTFADTQALPFGSVLSTGILLTSITCGTDTSSETCLPTADSAILTKGEIITPGATAPPAIKNTISKDDTTVSVDGLGVSVDFTSITTDGNLSVAIQDPDVTVANTGAKLSGNSGALAFTASGESITTVSSVIDFDLTGTTTSSGTMTITLPYDEAAANAAGITEHSLKVSHYVGGEWVVENNCTVNTTDNNITCIVDSIE
jgi:hypothetical protein